MTEKTFRDLEHQGWLEKAGAYRDMLGKLTEQAITPILDTFGDLSGSRFLDVASGTGELTAEAARRGAAAEGLDFAATMAEFKSRVRTATRSSSSCWYASSSWVWPSICSSISLKEVIR